MQTLVALYHDFADAQNAVDELVRGGFDRTKISLVANNATGEHSNYVSTDVDYDSEDAVTAEQGAAFGAASGGIIGALVGLGALAIPGIGPVIAAGPLIAALAGGAIGALAGAPTGGLVGGLIKTHHMDAEDAEIYAEGVRRGETLLTVQVDDSAVSQTRDILNKYNPTDVHGEASNWRQTGWSKFDESTTPTTDEVKSYRQRSSSSTGMGASTNADQTQPSRTSADGKTVLPIVEEHVDVSQREVEKGKVRVYTEVTEKPVSTDVSLRQENVMVERHPSDRPVNATDAAFRDNASAGSGFNAYDTSFRTDYQTRYGHSGRAYDVYMPAYQYGYTLASDESYKGQDWSAFETNARTQWEREHPDTLWDDIKDAARYAWDTVTGRR